MSTCREGTLLGASTWPFNRNMLFLSSLVHALELHALQSAAHTTKLKGYGSFCADMSCYLQWQACWELLEEGIPHELIGNIGKPERLNVQPGAHIVEHLQTTQNSYIRTSAKHFEAGVGDFQSLPWHAFSGRRGLGPVQSFS